MSAKYQRFKSSYLMRSRHQKTDLGTIMERDWVTTNGLNVLRFGSGRRSWYNSGNFVFTTSNVPTYHKKHKLSTETREWMWDDCKTADGTVNSVVPSYNTNDLRNYAYYGSCLELIRATIEEIIGDFPGRLTSTLNRPSSGSSYSGDVDTKTDLVRIASSRNDGDTSYDRDNNSWYIYHDKKWNYVDKIDNEAQGKSMYGDEIGHICHDLSDNTVKILRYDESGKYIYFEQFGLPTGKFTRYYVHDEQKYYVYDYHTGIFKEDKDHYGLVDGYIVRNPFNIDLHHKNVSLGKYDNPMRFITKSADKYCVVVNDGDEDNLTGVEISEWKGDLRCPMNDEGNEVITVTIKTESNESGYVIHCYSIGGSIVYVYRPEDDELISIQPRKEVIDEYFTGLTGFKRQLLRQDTVPFYSNVFITPVEDNFVWLYPEKSYVWPSSGYCIDIESTGFETFINRLYEIGSKLDELWCDNLYRSMTHESIKNFDWTYSRDYYEGDAQDNIDGGERMKKIIRVLGRVFDDARLYIDGIGNTSRTTYDCIDNGPDALISDNCELHGADAISTIGKDYDNDAYITREILDKTVSGKCDCWPGDGDDDRKSNLPLWYPTRWPNDIYGDVCDNEFMRRMLLSVKRIMATKGTMQSIEMAFGLFGLGCGKDYTIEEEAFYTNNMIRSDECVDGSVENEDDGSDWTTVDGVDWGKVKSRTKGELAVEINESKNLDRLYDMDPLSGTPMREVLLGRKNTSYMVPYYDSSQIYDGNLIFQGKGGWGRMIHTGDSDPLDDIFDYHETVSYLHVVGSVGEMLSVNPNIVGTNTVYYVADLRDYTNYDENPPMDLDNGITMSHYFILLDGNAPNRLSSWRNIVVKNKMDEDGNLVIVDSKKDFQNIFGYGEEQTWAYSVSELPGGSGSDVEQKLGTYVYAFAKMKYLDGIVSTNIANNPHVGYGKYDDGKEFIDFMKLPFKHVIDKYLIPFNLHSLAGKYEFNDIPENRTTDKIKIMNTREIDGGIGDFVRYEKNDDENTITKTYEISDCNYVADKDLFDGENLIFRSGDIVDSEMYKKIPESCQHNCSVNVEFYKSGDERFNSGKSWYVNTKVVTIKYIGSDGKCSYVAVKDVKRGEDMVYVKGTVISGEEYVTLPVKEKLLFKKHYLFDEYFKSVIMPYVMQVIPSTTILKLNGFTHSFDSDIFVDLALPSGTKWLRNNIGAGNETEYGKYFQWGDAVGHYSSDGYDFKWSVAPFNDGSDTFNEAYFNAHKNEFVNTDYTLKSEYDAANVNVGDGWRLPTSAEIRELIDNTSMTWLNDYKGSGINGCLFTSLVNGNTMFIPASGFASGKTIMNDRYYCNIWCSELDEENNEYATMVTFTDGYSDVNSTYRYIGHAVRGVKS